MGDLSVTVLVGRSRWQFAISPQATFGQLRSLVEQKEGAVQDGLRLIFKGKSYPNHTKLCEARVVNGAKMMALRTAKQCNEESAQQKRAALNARQHKTLSEMRHEASASASASANASSANAAQSSVRAILGDDPVEGVPCVLIIHARQKYRFNVQMSHTVLSLKEKAAAMPSIQSRPSNMRLLFRGKILKDEATLEQVGAKHGSSFMLLFNAKHHDAVEHKQQISSIDHQLQQLEANASAVSSQVEHRLLDSVDLAVKKSELQDVLHRLKDNLFSVPSDDERRASMQQRLEAVERIISQL